MNWIEEDSKLKRHISASSTMGESQYEFLFKYFLSGWVQRRTVDGAYAAYSGAPSFSGRKSDLMEGFTRFLPMLSAWLSGQRSRRVTTLDQQEVDLIGLANQGLTAGTNSNSASYWGHMGDFDQRVAEAPDVALSLWLLRDSAWKELSRTERHSILTWLGQVNGVQVPDNNWHLMIVFVNLVLETFGAESSPESLESHYSRFKQFYRGSGWFSDGSDDKFDFYNAWQIHYLLYWINVIRPDFDNQFVTDALYQFASSFKYILSPQGLPIIGRSICYRLAAPTPLIAAASMGHGDISPGLAHRACDAVWQHFVRRGAVNTGGITQGYYEQDLRLLDNYSGPASSLLSLRSLVLMFTSDPSIWSFPHAPLPVEESDYQIKINETGWTVRGIQKTGEVIIEQEQYRNVPDRPIRRYTLFRRLLALVVRRPLRPNNADAKYRRFSYSSKNPFCGQASRPDRKPGMSFVPSRSVRRSHNHKRF